ncbi:MAG: hypothetical protein ACYDHX_07935 [Methanothrix sp.]
MSPEKLRRFEDLLQELSDEPDIGEGGNPCPIRLELMNGIPHFLAHIDEQAERIEVLKNDLDNTLTDLKHEKERVEIMHLRRDNELHLDNEIGAKNVELEKQIALLKTATRKYLVKSIYLDHPDRPFESAIVTADKQLARELPDIFKEERQ